jgi:predicted DNA repair protein MutK
VHDLESAVSDLDAVGGVAAWLVNTLISALIGLVVGLAVVAVVTVVRRRRT